MKAAVIGCGSQGSLHLDALSRQREVDIVAVCDRDEARVSAAGDRFGIRHRYQDYRALLDANHVDLLIICTMANTHREIALAAFDVGSNVLCEKPIAMNANEAAEMSAAAVDAARLLVVGFNMRFTTSATAIRSFLDDGGLGTPICARGFTLESDIPWWGPHYVRELSGGGALASTAIHMLDLIYWLVGRPLPTTATASMGRVFPRKRSHGAPSARARADFSTEDLVFGHIRFDNGFWMSIESSWVWDKPGKHHGFELIGDRAQAELYPLRLVREEQGQLIEITGQRSGDVDLRSAVPREIDDVVSSIRDGHPPTVAASGAEGVVTQALVDALYSSAASGNEVAVRIPPLLSNRPPRMPA